MGSPPLYTCTCTQVMIASFVIIYIQRKIFFRSDNFLIICSPCHCRRAWIRVFEAPGCYERVARAERKSTLQGLGMVRTMGPCAQRRVALMPWAIATARDVFCQSNDRRECAVRFKRQACGAGTSASHRASSEARGKVVLCHTCQ